MLSSQHQLGVEYLIRSELGIKLDKASHPWKLDEEYPDFENFFTQSQIRDLLDTINLAFNYMAQDNSLPDYFAQHWATEAGRILTEENTAYRVGQDGIVHPFVDEEFETNRKSALEALSSPMFGEARADFEAAYRHLRGREYKQAIRMMFPAVEVAAKVLFPDTFARLMPSEVDRYPKIPSRAGLRR
jgi:hypothetical protein